MSQLYSLKQLLEREDDEINRYLSMKLPSELVGLMFEEIQKIEKSDDELFNKFLKKKFPKEKSFKELLDESFGKSLDELFNELLPDKLFSTEQSDYY